MLHRIFSVERD